MNRALPLLLLAGCGSSAAAPPPPATHLIVRIADVSDCGGSGTTCPELTNVRRVRVGLDGSVEPGPRQGVAVGAHQVAVGSLKIPLRGFGRSPRLISAPGDRRFAVLEDDDAPRVDHVLI